MSDNGELQEQVGAVLGRVPSGVFILVAGDGTGRTTGMLASWVQQAAFAPPMVTIAVNAKRYLNDWLAESPEVVLNLVAETQGKLLGHFGKGFEPDEEAFEGLSTETSSNGLPVLTDTLGHLSGRVANRIEAGDHVVYAVEITGGASGPGLADGKPFVHIRKSGFNY